MCGHGLLCSWPWSLVSLLGSVLFWLVWPHSHRVPARLLEPWPCSGCGLGVLPAIAQTQLSPCCSVHLGGRGAVSPWEGGASGPSPALRVRVAQP